MRLTAFLIVGLLATVPGVAAGPTVDVHTDTWQYVMRDSPVDFLDEYAQGEAAAAQDSPIDYVLDFNESEPLDAAARGACWTGLYFAPTGYEFLAKEDPSGAMEFCEEQLEEEDREKSFSADGVIEAAGRDAKSWSQKAAAIYRYAFDTLVDFVFG